MSIIKQDYGSFQDMATQHMLAPILQNLINTTGAVISAGSYFIFNNELYKATADIAANATIVVGTNAAAAKTITEEMNDIIKAPVSYESVTLNSGITGNVYAARQGNIVTLIVNISAGLTAGGRKYVCSDSNKIAAKYRPPHSFYTSAFSSNDKVGELSISNGGEISILSSEGATSAYGVATYLVTSAV